MNHESIELSEQDKEILRQIPVRPYTAQWGQPEGVSKMTLADFTDECGIDIERANEWRQAGIIEREDSVYGYRLTRPILLRLNPDGTRDAILDDEGLPVTAPASEP